MLYLIIKLYLIFFVAITITAESANAQINITQHANNIFNCTNIGIFGNKSCFKELVINSHQENNKFLSSPSDSTRRDVEQNREILSVINEGTDQPKKKASQLDGFFLTAIGSFIGTGGLILIGWRVKKIFLVQETKELKERIEILEIIITKE